MDTDDADGRVKKALSNYSSRTIGALALLALVPAVAFGLGKSLPAGAVTAVNVLLISASIYLLVSPVDGGHDDDTEDGDDRGLDGPDESAV